jgi:prevent-host-death family protein
MPTISEVAARTTFSDLINRVAYGRERVVVTRRGHEVVAVVPVEDVALLELLEDEFDLTEARAALADRDENSPTERAPEPYRSGR